MTASLKTVLHKRERIKDFGGWEIISPALSLASLPSGAVFKDLPNWWIMGSTCFKQVSILQSSSNSDGLQPTSDGLKPTSDGIQPNQMASNLVTMASNPLAMASNLLAMASNLRAMASNLVAMASNILAIASNQRAITSNLLAMASNLIAMASNPRAMVSNLLAMASNLLAMASNLRAMASNLLAMASNLVAMASNLRALASNLRALASNLVATVRDDLFLPNQVWHQAITESSVLTAAKSLQDQKKSKNAGKESLLGILSTSRFFSDLIETFGHKSIFTQSYGQSIGVLIPKHREECT